MRNWKVCSFYKVLSEILSLSWAEQTERSNDFDKKTRTEISRNKYLDKYRKILLFVICFFEFYTPWNVEFHKKNGG